MQDAASYHHILSCPEVSRYSDIPHQPTLKRSERFISWMSKLEARKKGVAWVICLSEQTDSHLGQLSTEHKTVIGSIRINSIEKKARCGMLGYEIHPTYWSNGYATEALGAVASYAYGDLGLNRLEAWTTEGNAASDKVLLKNGFQLEGTQREKVFLHNSFHHIRLFGRLACDKPSN